MYPNKRIRAICKIIFIYIKTKCIRDWCKRYEEEAFKWDRHYKICSILGKISTISKTKNLAWPSRRMGC